MENIFKMVYRQFLDVTRLSYYCLFFMASLGNGASRANTNRFSVKGQVDGLKGTVSDQFKGMGEALGSLPSFDINRFKFWE